MNNPKKLVDFLERRINFLIVFKNIINKHEEYSCMMPIFKEMESDYTKGISPVMGKEKVYSYFKTPDVFEQFISTKLGKFLRKNYKEYVPKDHILSEFVAIVNAIVWKTPPVVNIYTGKDIITAYESLKGRNGLDTCMVKKDLPKKLLKIYANNPDKVSLYTFEDVEHIKARVLIWTLENGDKIVDRIYPNTGENFQKLQEYFKNKKGFYVRKHHKQCKTCTHKIPILQQGEVSIILNRKGITRYPYFDTFHYGYIEGNNLVLSNAKLDRCDLQFSSTKGIPHKICITTE